MPRSRVSLAVTLTLLAGAAGLAIAARPNPSRLSETPSPAPKIDATAIVANASDTDTSDVATDNLQATDVAEIAPESASEAPTKATAETSTTGDATATETLISQAVRQGQFQTVDAAHPTSGTARLVTNGGQATVQLDNFQTERGPTVEVVLYTGNSIPLKLETAAGSYVSLGTVQSFSGNQDFAVPAGVDLSQYEAIGIWCRQFDITFGYADI